MTNIKITPVEDKVTLRFKYNTPLHFTYTISVQDSKTGKDIIEPQKGSWKTNTEFLLEPADKLVGNLLCIEWTILDLVGTEKYYDAEAIVYKNGIECLEHQICKGELKPNRKNYSTTGKFI